MGGLCPGEGYCQLRPEGIRRYPPGIALGPAGQVGGYPVAGKGVGKAQVPGGNPVQLPTKPEAEHAVHHQPRAHKGGFCLRSGGEHPYRGRQPGKGSGGKVRIGAAVQQEHGTLCPQFRQLPGAHKAVAAVIALSAEHDRRSLWLTPLIYGRPGKLRPGPRHHLPKAYPRVYALRLQALHLGFRKKLHLYPPSVLTIRRSYTIIIPAKGLRGKVKFLTGSKVCERSRSGEFRRVEPV